MNTFNNSHSDTLIGAAKQILENVAIAPVSDDFTNVTEGKDNKLSGRTVEIEVPFEWLELAYNSEKSPAVLADIMKQLLAYKGGPGLSTSDRFNRIKKLTKNNTRPAVDGIRTQKDSKLRSDLPEKPYGSPGTTGW